MAQVRSIEVSKLLCYVTHILGRLDAQRFKSILVIFYLVEAPYIAKELLVNIVDVIHPDKWARPNMIRGKASVSMATDDKTKK